MHVNIISYIYSEYSLSACTQEEYQETSSYT